MNSVKNIEIECTLSAWQIEDYRNEVLREDSIFIIAEKDEKIVGYAVSRLIMKSNTNLDISGKYLNKKTVGKYDQIEIYNIGVCNKYRRQGIGNGIIKKVLNLAKEQAIKEIWLDVRKSNKTALKFYKNLGFSKAYERKNFYTFPLENAIVMSFKI